MLFNIIKKQFLLLVRNPVEIFLLLGLPIILITILGNALSSWMNGETPAIQGKVAILEEDGEEEQVERFLSEIEHIGLPEETVTYLEQEIRNIAPVHLLKGVVFGNEQLEEMIRLEEAPLSQKNIILEDNTYSVVIEVPENFTYETLKSMILGEDNKAELIIYENDQQQIAAGVIKNILRQFQERITAETFLQQNYLNSEVILNQEEILYEITTIRKKNPINAKEYYTVGMAAMNVLFIASIIASFSFLEKKTNVFDRIILANVSRWIYFIGILLSSTVFALTQLLIIFGFSRIVFGVSWPDLSLFFLTTTIFALAVGGIAVLLTSVCYRLESENITNIFSGAIVMIMAFFGGSFFPVGDSSEWIQRIGDYTPNGASMSVYLALLRGDGLSEVLSHLLFLVLFAFLAILIAGLTFPKRGVSS